MFACFATCFTDRSGQKLSNITFYDLKQLYTQAKNYALNISEIEAKVREATNDDPWCVPLRHELIAGALARR